MKTTDLSAFNNSWYKPGKNGLIRVLWYFTNILVIMNPLNPFSGIKTWILRLFGAEIGENAVIKPGVNIKYPWRLKIGDNCWLGEKTWIDNLGMVTIGNNVCLSQGVLLLCGNHNYKSSSFDLIVGDIVLEDGVWLGAKSVVGPGVTVGSHAVLTVGSVTGKDLSAWKIYRGNPAVEIREREIAK
jgi:putative colanic acid biosynthesis acetyltransferase WcaF